MILDSKSTMFYESPSASILEIEAELVICQSGGTERFTDGNSYGDDDFE